MIFVGIDWADKEHEVCVLDQDGTELAHFRIPHTHNGLETLKKQLLRYVTSPEEAPCFLETSQGQSLPVPPGGRIPRLPP